MDVSLLGRAVEHHGPDLVRHLHLEQQVVPDSIYSNLQRHKPHQPEIDDPLFIQNIRRFISTKADMLFKPVEVEEQEKLEEHFEDDCYAKLPPLETFMGISEQICRAHFYNSLEKGDVVVGVITQIMESGLVLTVLSLDEGKSRDIDNLRVSAFIPVKEIPRLFQNQNPVEGYQVKDNIRGIVVNVNPETERIIVSLIDRDTEEERTYKPLLGLIQEEDFPVQYRRKINIRGLTFDELLNSILGFSNPGNVQHLLGTLKQNHEASLMRGLHRLKIPEKEYADSLKKHQSQKWAYQSVAQGIAFFKEGRQTEAMQQLNKALQIDPTNVEALVARGALYANNESYTRALEDFNEARKINPKHANALKYTHETLLAKGKSHEDQEEWEEAEKCYQESLDVQPDSQEAKESIRYVKYKQDSEKKDDRKRKKDKQSPLPFEKTTETLKKLIKEEKQDTRSKKIARTPDKSRKRSRSYSSSSSSSTSSSSSGSASVSRSQSLREKQRPESLRRSLSGKRKDSWSPSGRRRRSRSRSASLRSRPPHSSKKRSRSPKYIRRLESRSPEFRQHSSRSPTYGKIPSVQGQIKRQISRSPKGSDEMSRLYDRDKGNNDLGNKGIPIIKSETKPDIQNVRPIGVVVSRVENDIFIPGLDANKIFPDDRNKEHLGVPSDHGRDGHTPTHDEYDDIIRQVREQNSPDLYGDSKSSEHVTEPKDFSERHYRGNVPEGRDVPPERHESEQQKYQSQKFSSSKSPRYLDSGRSRSPRYSDRKQSQSPRFFDKGHSWSPRYSDKGHSRSPRYSNRNQSPERRIISISKRDKQTIPKRSSDTGINSIREISTVKSQSDFRMDESSRRYSGRGDYHFTGAETEDYRNEKTNYECRTDERRKESDEYGSRSGSRNEQDYWEGVTRMVEETINRDRYSTGGVVSSELSKERADRDESRFIRKDYNTGGKRSIELSYERSDQDRSTHERFDYEKSHSRMNGSGNSRETRRKDSSIDRDDYDRRPLFGGLLREPEERRDLPTRQTDRSYERKSETHDEDKEIVKGRSENNDYVVRERRSIEMRRVPTRSSSVGRNRSRSPETKRRAGLPESNSEVKPETKQGVESDIFQIETEDEKNLNASRQKLFETYVPRAVKLKQHSIEKDHNPESLLPPKGRYHEHELSDQRGNVDEERNIRLLSEEEAKKRMALKDKTDEEGQTYYRSVQVNSKGRERYPEENKYRDGRGDESRYSRRHSPYSEEASRQPKSQLDGSPYSRSSQHEDRGDYQREAHSRRRKDFSEEKSERRSQSAKLKEVQDYHKQVSPEQRRGYEEIGRGSNNRNKRQASNEETKTYRNIEIHHISVKKSESPGRQKDSYSEYRSLHRKSNSPLRYESKLPSHDPQSIGYYQTPNKTARNQSFSKSPDRKMYTLESKNSKYSDADRYRNYRKEEKGRKRDGSRSWSKSPYRNDREDPFYKSSDKKRAMFSRSRSKSTERVISVKEKLPTVKSDENPGDRKTYGRSRSRSSSPVPKTKSSEQWHKTAGTLKEEKITSSKAKNVKSNSAQKSKGRSREEERPEPVPVPTIPSKWDSPEPKRNRWQETITPAELKMPLVIEKVSEIANMLKIQSIPESPPPHRKMKPHEKEAMVKKWSELTLPDTNTNVLNKEKDSQSLTLLKTKDASGESERKTSITSENKRVSKDFEEDIAKDINKEKSSSAAGNYEKRRSFKKKLRSKWDSDSDSSTGSDRSSSRDRQSKSRDKEKNTAIPADKTARKEEGKSQNIDEKDSKEKKENTRERSGDRSARRYDRKSRDHSRGRSKDRKSRDRSKDRRSRDRSRSRRSRDRSRDRRSRDRSRDRRSRDRSRDRHRRDSGKHELPDLVSSTKKYKRETSPRIFWFHREAYEEEQKKKAKAGNWSRDSRNLSSSRSYQKSKSRSRSHSPARRKSTTIKKVVRSPTPEVTRAGTVSIEELKKKYYKRSKSSDSSSSDSSHKRRKKERHKKEKAKNEKSEQKSASNKRESLDDLESFLGDLKKEKKKQWIAEGKLKTSE